MGQVIARRDADGAIRFEERGCFELDATRARLPFRNMLRWSLGVDSIALAHCRHDAVSGTRLVEFRPPAMLSNEAGLVAVAPHACGRDCYDAVVRLVDNGFDLHWRITGPRKDEELVHRYRSDARPSEFREPGERHGPIDGS